MSLLTHKQAWWPHFFNEIFKMFISWMFITPSFKKSLIVEQFQRNYLKHQPLSQGATAGKGANRLTRSTLILSKIILGQMISNLAKHFPDYHNPCHCQMTLLAYPKCKKKKKQVDSRLWCILCICLVTDHGDGTRMWEEQKSDKQPIRWMCHWCSYQILESSVILSMATWNLFTEWCKEKLYMYVD